MSQALNPPRWLSKEELRAWIAFLRATRLLFAELERDTQRGARMPLTYYEVLSTLSESPGRALRLGAIADILQVSPSRLSHAIDRLEEAGWVRREPCPSDRRGWVAVLTDEGFAVLEAAAPVHVESVRRHLVDVLTPEQLQQLGAISETLLAHLSHGDTSPSRSI
jgi:DNA-binding MarR family transcriptional regulator